MDGQIIGAEIGVFRGEMSDNLLKLLPNLRLYMVDRWQPYSYEEQRGDPRGKMCKEGREFWDEAYSDALSVAVSHGQSRAHIIRGESIKAAQAIPNRSLDFAFIDGDHSYKGAKRDIICWIKKVKIGGVLCGHDRTRDGVSMAINEVLKCRTIEADADNTWFYIVRGDE